MITMTRTKAIEVTKEELKDILTKRPEEQFQGKKERNPC